MPDQEKQEKEVSSTPYFVTWMGALVIVSGLIWGAVWLMQR